MIKTTSKSILVLTLLAIPVVGTAITACSTEHQQQESTGQYIDGSVITAKVKSRLLADKATKNFPITVKTYKNTVQLSGYVNNQYQKQRAVAIASEVEGVAYVQDVIAIKKR